METTKALHDLEKIISEIVTLTSSVSNVDFFHKPHAEKWSVAEEVHHLTLCTFPINNILNKPGLAIEKYGSSARISRSNATFTAHYYDATEGIPWRSFAPFIPKENNEQNGYIALHETGNLKKMNEFYSLAGEKIISLREKMPMDTAAGKEEIVRQFVIQSQQFMNHIKNASPQELDEIQLPLPYMGLITLKEMLFFTVMHTKHHANSIQKTLYTLTKISMVK